MLLEKMAEYSPKVLHYVVPEPSTTDPLNIYILADVHYLSSQCDVRLLKRTIKHIQSDPMGKVILLGDIFDAILPGDPRFDFTILPRELLADPHNMKYIASFIKDEGIKILEPLKDKILLYITGNHEEALQKHLPVDVFGEIASVLNIPLFGYHGHIILTLGERSRQTVDIYVFHGKSASSRIPTQLSSLMSLAQNTTADIFIAGHTHNYVVAHDVGEKRDGKKIKFYPRLFMIAPGFRKYFLPNPKETSYEERKRYGYPMIGAPVIQIFLKKEKGEVWYQTIP